MRRFTSRPSHTTVIAYVALFVALGGGAYAATLPKNSVGPKQLKSNAVTGTDANEATFGQVPSAAFATSAGTATSAANGVKAYAQVQPHAGALGEPCDNGPGLDECLIFRSKGVAKVTNVDSGEYCVFVPGVSPFSDKGPAYVVSVDAAGTPYPANASVAVAAADAAGCAGDHGALTVITTRQDLIANTISYEDDVGFTIVVP
jgi:hypothetical protein